MWREKSCLIRFVKIIANDLHYKCPDWLNKQIEPKDYAVLSKNTSEDEVDLILVQLLLLNDIVELEKHPNQIFHHLIEKEHISISGGFLFIENSDKMVFPGCCSFIDEWRTVLDDVIKKQSPWLGHDPYPVMEFVGDKVRVWSDDGLGIWDQHSKKDLYFIEFDYEDLINQLKAAETDLKEFIHCPLYNRIKQFDESLAKRTVVKLQECLDIRSS